ncbi:uncharacterized protein LOC126379088 [Pectinophora gossypiella]|uniref:uncharacterized protein LOC126379088 n=1 Tax=Pectinophora gossypiella TaxID=13191 RepID=UPI00214E3107|nr:uncharacterized protein LOC126379088 [Pectinophora gossypiella]
MEGCKNYSQSSIDLYRRALVESSIELEERSRSMPLADRGDNCGYGYKGRSLPHTFPYTLESTVGNEMAMKRFVTTQIKKGIIKRPATSCLGRMRPWLDNCRYTCTRFFRCMVYVVQRAILFGFWSWICISLINLFKTAEISFVKRHAVIPRSIRMPDLAYHLIQVDAEELTIKLKLYGPFIPYLQQNREYNDVMMAGDHKQYVFHCYLERWIYQPSLLNPNLYKLLKQDTVYVDYAKTAVAKIMMTNDSGTTHKEPLDYNNYPRNARLALPTTTYEGITGNATASIFYALGFGVDTTQEASVPFSMEYKIDPINMRTRVLIGMIPLLVFCALLILQVNRGVAAYIAMCTALAGFVKTGEEILVSETGQWLNTDIVLYVFAAMMLVSILSETRLYSCIGYHFLRLTNRDVSMTLILLNLLTGFFSIFFNNMFIAILMAPLAIRMMEFLDRNPYPVLINLMMICNICGKAYVGTFIVREILQHIEAINTGITLKRIMNVCMVPSLIVAGATGVVWFLIYSFLKPHEYRKRIDIADLEHQLILWKRMYNEIPNVSYNWHVIRKKIQDKRTALKAELVRLKALPTPDYMEMKTDAYFRELYYDARVYNWFLVVKVAVAAIGFMGLVIIYIYNVYIEQFHGKGDIKLGYIGLYAVLLLFLLLHSRDFGLLLKRMDWQAIVIFVAFGIIIAVFIRLTGHMDDFLWKMYGTYDHTVMSRKRKIHMIFAQMLSYTSISGVCNEHVVSMFFLDTILQFSIFRGLNAIGELLGGFIMATGFWGNATILGTGASILIAGVSDDQGYSIKFINHMWYGIPVAIMNVLLLYVYVGFTYLI